MLASRLLRLLGVVDGVNVDGGSRRALDVPRHQEVLLVRGEAPGLGQLGAMAGRGLDQQSSAVPARLHLAAVGFGLVLVSVGMEGADVSLGLDEHDLRLELRDRDLGRRHEPSPRTLLCGTAVCGPVASSAARCAAVATPSATATAPASAATPSAAAATATARSFRPRLAHLLHRVFAQLGVQLPAPDEARPWRRIILGRGGLKGFQGPVTHPVTYNDSHGVR